MALDCPTYKDYAHIVKEYQYGSAIVSKEKKARNIISDIFDLNNQYSNEVIFLEYDNKRRITNYNFKDLFLEIDNELAYLQESFKKSEYIINLEDDWDDEGSPKYNIQTWFSALKFVNEYANILLLNFNKKIVPPKIYHGPGGSIDILFETKNYTLLINILSEGLSAAYFGKDNNNNTIKGTMNLNNINKALIPLAFIF